MARKKLLIVDGNNTLFRAYYKFKGKGFTNSKGTPTGCIYGFFRILQHNIVRFDINRVIVCFDNKRSPYRLKIYPDYKGGRKDISMDYISIMKQKNSICRILRNLGVSYVLDTKNKYPHEADDWITLATDYYYQWDRYILSSDEDFVQLLSKNVKIINPSKELIISTRNCEEVYGYTPEHALDTKIMVGDSSDNIKGFPGIGPKKAKAILEKYGTAQKYIGSIGDLDLTNKYFINNQLINLRDFQAVNRLKATDKVPYHRRRYNEDILTSLFDHYSLKSFKSREFMDSFKKLYYNG